MTLLTLAKFCKYLDELFPFAVSDFGILYSIVDDLINLS